MRFSHFRSSLFVTLILFSTTIRAETDEEKFFETKIRPLLAARCWECHGDETQEGDLRLDHREFLFREQSPGPFVIPGNLQQSVIWQAVQYKGGDVEMPPDGKLPAEELDLLKRWIERGAHWPDDGPVQATPAEETFPRTAEGAIDFDAAALDHWAYRRVEKPDPPEVQDAAAIHREIDRFLLARLESQSLTFSPQASRETLVRRVSFDLRGIPPTIAEVEEFLNDDRADAYELLVDRSLASPRYGERWGRHWLDIARYADTKGYVFTENRFYPYSYTYRDYVIEALNRDTPYDLFLREQLAADQLGYPEHDSRLAALGFLTAGPRFRNNEQDIIDDRIDVVTRGLMGMTATCARCHDHKYDPIPMEDYYSLYGVFQSCYEPDMLPLIGTVDESTPEFAAYNTELEKRRQAVQDYVDRTLAELLSQARQQASDYLVAIAQMLGKVPADVAPEHGKLRDRLKLHWKQFGERRALAQDPFFVLLAQLLNTPAETFPEQIAQLSASASPQTTLVISALQAELPQSHLEMVRTFGRVLMDVDREWKTIREQNGQVEGFDDPAKEALRTLLFGPGSLSDVPASETSLLFERDHRDQLRRLNNTVKDWQVSSPDAPPRGMVLLEKESPVEPVVFLRGDRRRPGDPVPRRMLRIIDRNPAARFEQGSGRLELAHGVASPENPLTARVLVNRVWMYHFASPLVATPSDFGPRGSAPTHPELLEHLSWMFMHEWGWSLKELHRQILLSAAYRQSSDDRPKARAIDGENRLYWRQNRRRHDFEALRDAMLAVAGRLDLKMGGKPVNLETRPFSNRRSVYGLIDRNNFSSLLRTFDFPSPDTSSPQRPETTVPQQALYVMNAPFVQETADALAQRLQARLDHPQQQVAELIRLAYSRAPREGETDLLQAFLDESSLPELCQAVLMSNEFLFVD